MIKKDNVLPKDDGCWFCHCKDNNLVFDSEFDTNVHIDCIITALKKDPEDMEAKLMSYLLDINNE